MSKIDKRQTVEEAAKDYAIGKTFFRKNVLKEVDADDYVLRKDNCREDFKAGAEWQAKQSTWVSVEERLPENQDIVLVRDEYGGKATAYLHGKDSGLSFTGRTLIRYSERLPIGAIFPILRNSINRAFMGRLII